jgi:hypothetical protein
MKKDQAVSLLQIGIFLAVAGFAIKIALAVGMVLDRFAGLAILAGIILAVIGLFVPGKRNGD